jgi:predicted RNase H-like HicB family nuclease
VEVQVKFRVLIETDEDGAFCAVVPSLPGCVSQGQTRVEALVEVTV